MCPWLAFLWSRFFKDSWVFSRIRVQCTHYEPSAVYMDVIKLPLFADFDCPEKYGLSRENLFSITPYRRITLRIQRIRRLT